MAQRIEDRSIDDAVELLKENGFDGLAEAVTVLMNAKANEPAAVLVHDNEYPVRFWC